MSYKGPPKVQKVMVQPINLIFRYLQNRSRVQVSYFYGQAELTYKYFTLVRFRLIPHEFILISRRKHRKCKIKLRLQSVLSRIFIYDVDCST